MNSYNRFLVFLLIWLSACCVINVIGAELAPEGESGFYDTSPAEPEDETALYDTSPTEPEDETALYDTSPTEPEDETGFYETAPAEPVDDTSPTEPEDETAPQTPETETESLPSGETDEQGGESPRPDGENTAMSSAVIDDENIVVYSFDELKSALSGSNRYVNIYLGANIDMKALGIEIHSTKKRVLISGKNPLDGSGPYTINEYNSLDPGYTIRVISNSGAKEVTMKDINVTGRNYYGAVCVYDGVTDVKVTFENVSYNGPQISYNRGGTVCITGSSDIRIHGGNGLSEAQELAEANALELGGNAVINHYAPVMSGLWLVGSGSYIKVLSGARVTWNETGSYMIFQDNISPAELTLESYAGLTVNTANGLFYNQSATLHQFGSVLLGYGAALEINQTGASQTPVLKVKNGITVLEDASLAVLAQSAPCLLYMTGAADLTVSSPDTLALYNKTGRLIDWSDTGLHNISILSSFINYWSAPGDLAALGGLNESPLYRWRKKNGGDLSVEITASSAATETAASNYTADDFGEPPDSVSFNVQSARVITAGKMSLNLDAIFDTSLYLSGQTEPHAELRAVYKDTNGIEREVYGAADSGGAFDIGLGTGNSPASGETVTVYASLGYKSVLESAAAAETEGNILSFIHVPKAMIFPKTRVTANKEQVARADENWHIIIEDTRSQGAKWELFVRLKTPLTERSGDAKRRLEDAVIFKDNGGGLAVLGETAVLAASGVSTGEPETVVGWPPDTGIMLYIDTLKAFTGTSYEAEIEWILADAP